MAKTDPAEQEVTLNMQQLVELVKSMAATSTLDVEAIAAITAKAAVASAELIHPTKDHPYPAISAFNPEGELKNPRPELKGDIYWAGYLLRGDELTRKEIDLLNQLRPGDYELGSRGGTSVPFRVRDLDPGSRDSRRLLVLFPCTTQDQRSELPTMVEMLTQVLQPVAA